MPTPHPVLIVGGGNIAGGFDSARGNEGLPLTHAGAFSRHPGFRLAACIEPDPERAKAFAAHWSIPRMASSFAELDAPAGAFDVISICSPTAAHAQDIASALALKPRLIFCEKPVSPDVDATGAVVAACEAAGVTLMVNHTRRWAPDIGQLRADIAARAWGSLRSATGIYNKGVLNNGSHMLDLLSFLVGPLTPLWAGRPHWDHWPDDPTIAAALEGPDGLPIMLNIADARDYALFELELVLERAVIRMEQGGGSWHLRHAIDSPTFSGYKTLDAGRNAAGRYDAAMTAAIAEIAAVLDTGAEPASTGRTALATQQLCHRIRQLAQA